MAAITERFQESVGRRFNWQYFLQDNITGSWLLTIWVIVLSLATLALTIQQSSAFPTATIIIVLAWFICYIGGCRRRAAYSPFSPRSLVKNQLVKFRIQYAAHTVLAVSNLCNIEQYLAVGGCKCHL